VVKRFGGGGKSVGLNYVRQLAKGMYSRVEGYVGPVFKKKKKPDVERLRDRNARGGVQYLKD